MAKATTLKTKNHEVDVIIGGNVRRLRLLKGMSQETLADALGLTFQQVQKYEKGTNRLSGSRMVQTCSALGCGTSDLFVGTGAAAKGIGPDPALSILQTERGIRLARVFNKLPQKLQLQIVGLCEDVAQ